MLVWSIVGLVRTFEALDAWANQKTMERANRSLNEGGLQELML